MQLSVVTGFNGNKQNLNATKFEPLHVFVFVMFVFHMYLY